MSTSLHKAQRSLLGVSLLAAVIFVLYVFASVMTGGYWKHHFFPDFEESMRRNVDPRKIRTWADPILQGRNSKYQAGQKSISIDSEDVPDWLRKSSLGDLPISGDLVQDDGGAPVILLVQSSSFGALGLYIGKKDYVAKGDDHTIVKRWADGIYFFWE